MGTYCTLSQLYDFCPIIDRLARDTWLFIAHVRIHFNSRCWMLIKWLTCKHHHAENLARKVQRFRSWRFVYTAFYLYRVLFSSQCEIALAYEINIHWLAHKNKKIVRIDKSVYCAAKHCDISCKITSLDTRKSISCIIVNEIIFCKQRSRLMIHD